MGGHRRGWWAAVLVISFAVFIAAGALGWFVVSDGAMTNAASQAAAGNDVAPETPWRRLVPDTRLTRIAFGSCLDQNNPQPIWRAVFSRDPQLFLMIGDNVYGDIKSLDGRELTVAYLRQLANAEFSAARERLAMLATWDDHDYGANDAGADFAHRAFSEDLFRRFWQLEERGGPGIAFSRMIGPPEARVQIVMLDTRSFRSALKIKGDDFPYWGEYAPDVDPQKTMLGAAQWGWLEVELKKPATIRLLVSSVQVLSEGHGKERWGNLPKEREKLLSLIERTGAKGVIMLSGDRHVAAFYKATLRDGRVLPEFTSSSLNRAYGPVRDVSGPERVTDAYWRENFGEIAIDWEERSVRLRILGMEGNTIETWRLSFAELGR
jgi:alkaline phosphatase D